MKQKVAQFIRAASLPAVLALLLLCLLRGIRPDLFPRFSFPLSIIFIVILPMLPYPISMVHRKEGSTPRETQRSLAFVLTLLGHTVALVYGVVRGLDRELMLIYWTYFLSIILLFIFNKLLHIRASAHGAGMAGAFCLMPWLLGAVWWLPCAVVIAAVCWSSLVLNRHTTKELIFGACCGGLSFFFGLAITVLRAV